jgi:6-pyruvoyltetrahydropterin/6-carboxytetrahydropterin synthase
MQITVTKEFEFDAAHHLTKYYGKCEKVHGHTYKLLVTVSGELSSNDMLIDFIILKRVVKKHILDYLDHQDLNTIFTNPTTEKVAFWIWDKLKNIEQLLLQELEDPNLDDEIKSYLTSNDKIDKSSQNNKIRLTQIQLYESKTSFVTLSE